MTAPVLEALPTKARNALEQFAERLSGSLGENLVSLVLYGGAAKGRFEAESSDLNLLPILREASLGALDEIAAASAALRREAPVQLLILTESDLADCVEVFATKFRDIQRHHRLLRGRDVLSPLAISRERLLRQARREMVNLKLRLRQAYWQRGARLEMLDAMLARTCKTAAINVAALLEDGALPSAPDLSAAMKRLEQAGQTDGMEARCGAVLRELDSILQALGPA